MSLADAVQHDDERAFVIRSKVREIESEHGTDEAKRKMVHMVVNAIGLVGLPGIAPAVHAIINDDGFYMTPIEVYLKLRDDALEDGTTSIPTYVKRRYGHQNI